MLCCILFLCLLLRRPPGTTRTTTLFPDTTLFRVRSSGWIDRAIASRSARVRYRSSMERTATGTPPLSSLCRNPAASVDLPLPCAPHSPIASSRTPDPASARRANPSPASSAPPSPPPSRDHQPVDLLSVPL